MKSILDKANRDVEKERGVKVKPFVESYSEKKKMKTFKQILKEQEQHKVGDFLAN